MKRYPWLDMKKKTDVEAPLEPPILLGNKSNGEFFLEQTPRDRKIRDLILRVADEQAARRGMDRRQFLASSMGMAASLWAINLASGCGDDDGGFNVPNPGEMDCTETNEILSGDEFILDLQTHHIEDEERWSERHPGGTYFGEQFANGITFYPCDLEPRADCIGPMAYVDQVLMGSDTSVAVLSGFPSPICDDATLCTNLNSNEGMAYWRDFFNNSAMSQRVIQHCQVAPNDRWDLQSAMMDRVHEEYGNHGWKCYPPWAPGSREPWWLDDPIVADPFINKCKELGRPLICAHKGPQFPGFDLAHNDPIDAGRAAIKHPDASFIIYHSGVRPGVRIGPYDPAGDGTDSLVRTVLDHDLKGKNVFAELGSAWVLASFDAVQAQHLIGKLVKNLGEDNVLWGSECTWFGSPQPQIEAFRAFEISEEFQETYGYPELTPEIKAKILGLNAARLYEIDPQEVRCQLASNPIQMAKVEMDENLGPRRWAFQQGDGPQTWREFLSLQRWRDFLGVPA